MTAPAIIAVIAALSQPAPVRLTITVDPGNGDPAVAARLVCGTAKNSATGYLRPVGIRRACWKARRRTSILIHVPDTTHRACDQTFGGPETARVTGRIGRRVIRRRLARRDGCEIAEWDALVPLVPPHRIEGLGPSSSG
jgi:hypothetical protein